MSKRSIEVVKAQESDRLQSSTALQEEEPTVLYKHRVDSPLQAPQAPDPIESSVLYEESTVLYKPYKLYKP